MHKPYHHLAKAVLYMNTAIVAVGLFANGEYTQVSGRLYCICGVEVLPKVTFMPVDSFNVNIISRVKGTVQGTFTPWFSLIRSEGVATLLACALGTLTPRAALGTRFRFIQIFNDLQYIYTKKKNSIRTYKHYKNRFSSFNYLFFHLLISACLNK